MSEPAEEITIMGVKVRRRPVTDSPPAYRCEKCHDTGRIVYVGDDGIVYSRECECAPKIRSMQRLKISGLESLVRNYTFKNYKTPDAWHEQAKAKAKMYVKNPDGNWFFIAGTPGSGKTHLCTAICGQLIANGRDVRYMVWREAIPKLKALVNDDQYDDELSKYIRPSVLYIDDFLKGSVSQADLNLAFTILNARYNNPKKMTVISSERTLAEIRQMDAAVAGRIYERSKDYIFKTPAQDWRMT